MDGSSEDNTSQTPQNLNELQSLLSSFNKEIEDQPLLAQPSLDSTEQQVFIEVSNASTQHVTAPASSTQSFTGFYTEQSLLDSGLQDDSENQMSIVVTPSSEVQIQDGNSSETIPDQVQITDASVLADGLQPGQDISLHGFQASDLTTLNDPEGNVLRIVSIGNDGLMHIISEDQLQQGSEITTLSDNQLTEQIVDEQTGEGQSSIDGTDPVAVLASVAANTSSVSQLQTVTYNQADVNNPQLVAIQNSADSSQPQLVAVQNADGTSTEAVQIIGHSELTNINQALLASSKNNIQTVTLVPSESSPGGEVNYVLIMGSPDGESMDGKALSLDLSALDFKEVDREVTEELIEENGKTRRILRITPKPAYLASGQMMCSFCNYTSPKRYLLTRHMKTHSEERPHKCQICQRGFKTLASLTNHVNTHTGVRPHKCKFCESAFTTSGELVRHVRYKHTFEKPHKCTLCEYASVELSKLKRHMRSHTGERPYQCQHCSYASPDTYKLKRHLRIHTGEKPYECLICHAKFTQSNSLKAHKLIHTGTKPVFQCEYCPTTCGRRTDLKIHVQKLHNSDHPLLCRKCGESFPDRYTYKIHLRTHEGEKCYKCETCGYAASSQRHLESHQLIHSGEKPFECQSCEHSFRQKQLLKRHENLHHSSEEIIDSVDTFEECQDCHRKIPSPSTLTTQLTTQLNLKGEPQEGESSHSVITQSILQKNLMQEWRDGKLGNAQQVVIVHPDGTVEEVTHKLQESQTVDVNEGTEFICSSFETKPDVTDLVITDSHSEKELTVVPAIMTDGTVIDETKEAGTQVEIESDGDDKKSTENNEQLIPTSSNTDDSSIIIHGESSLNTIAAVDEEEFKNLHVHILQGTSEIHCLGDSHNVHVVKEPNNLHTDQHSQATNISEVTHENVVDGNHDSSDIFEDQINDSCDLQTDVNRWNEGEEAVENSETSKIEESEIESDSGIDYPLLLDTDDTIDDQKPDDPPESVDEVVATVSTAAAPATKVKTPVKAVASPNRQTRSMKRKESDESQSPAKRTRRATSDKN